MKIFTLVIYASCLIGCAAALVPESSSPRVKVDQASALFNEQGRPLAAIKLLNQAIPMAQKAKDVETEANAEFYLGEIYKTPGPNEVALKNPAATLEHHRKAIALYDSLKFYKRSAYVSFNSSWAYGLLGDHEGQCTSLRSARASLARTGADPRDTLPPGEDLPRSILELLKKLGC